MMEVVFWSFVIALIVFLWLRVLYKSAVEDPKPAFILVGGAGFGLGTFFLGGPALGLVLGLLMGVSAVLFFTWRKHSIINEDEKEIESKNPTLPDEIKRTDSNKKKIDARALKVNLGDVLLEEYRSSNTNVSLDRVNDSNKKQPEARALKANLGDELLKEYYSSNTDFSLDKVKGVKNIAKYKIDYFYHMTHRKNLSNILKNGLLSHGNRFVSKHIDNEAVNSRRDRLDPVYGLNLHSYVPFYFNHRNPMLYVQKEKQDKIVILGFSNELIFERNIVFTDGNAAVNTTKFFSDINDLYKLNWSCINGTYWSDHEDGKREIMSELLVPGLVSISELRIVFCKNIKTKLKVDEIISRYSTVSGSHVEVVVDESKFFRN